MSGVHNVLEAACKAVKVDPQRYASGKAFLDDARYDDLVQWTVTVSSLRDGSELRVLTVDKGHIDRVVFAGDQLLVRYHAKKRVAVFDAAGKSRRIAARELGGPGASVEELHPLRRGTTLAFAPYPRGEVFLVAADGKALETWRLSQKRVYQSGDSFLADGGRVIFAYSHQVDVTRLLAI